MAINAGVVCESSKQINSEAALDDSFSDVLNRFRDDFHKVCKDFSEKIAITYYMSNGEKEEVFYSQMNLE